MTLDAIVKVSFRGGNPLSPSPAPNAAFHMALVGVASGSEGSRPFRSVGRATYAARDADPAALGSALEALGIALREHGARIEFLSFTAHAWEPKPSPSDARNVAAAERREQRKAMRDLEQQLRRKRSKR